MDIGVEEVEGERGGDGDREGRGGCGGAAAEAERVDAGAVDVVEEERRERD